MHLMDFYKNAIIITQNMKYSRDQIYLFYFFKDLTGFRFNSVINSVIHFLFMILSCSLVV